MGPELERDASRITGSDTWLPPPWSRGALVERGFLALFSWFCGASELVAKLIDECVDRPT